VTFFGIALLTAIATVVLAVFAVVTAWYARKAFREQSREVAAIEQQVNDEQEVTRQQGELLKIQSGQLELQRQQLDDQRKASAAQADVLKLQAEELRESLDERKREAERRRRAQAAMVFLAQTLSSVQKGLGDPGPASISATAVVVNSSDQPVYDAELLWRRGSANWGQPNPEPLGAILPGGQPHRSREFPPDTNMNVSGAILRFTDAAGVRWIRRPDGYLGEQA
jgi:hypothetical protein